MDPAQRLLHSRPTPLAMESAEITTGGMEQPALLQGKSVSSLSPRCRSLNTGATGATGGRISGVDGGDTEEQPQPLLAPTEALEVEDMRDF